MSAREYGDESEDIEVDDSETSSDDADESDLSFVVSDDDIDVPMDDEELEEDEDESFEEPPAAEHEVLIDDGISAANIVTGKRTRNRARRLEDDLFQKDSVQQLFWEGASPEHVLSDSETPDYQSSESEYEDETLDSADEAELDQAELDATDDLTEDLTTFESESPSPEPAPKPKRARPSGSPRHTAREKPAHAIASPSASAASHVSAASHHSAPRSAHGSLLSHRSDAARPTDPWEKLQQPGLERSSSMAPLPDPAPPSPALISPSAYAPQNPPGGSALARGGSLTQALLGRGR
jgi:hypothetical protein